MSINVNQREVYTQKFQNLSTDRPNEVYKTTENPIEMKRTTFDDLFPMNLGKKQPPGESKLPEGIDGKFDQIYENEIELRQQLAGLDPDSAEAKMVQKRLEAMDDAKVGMLNAAAEQYPAGSKDQNALKTMGMIIKEDSKTEAIDQYLKALNESTGNLKNQLAEMEPDSPEAKRLQAQLNSLEKVETGLLDKKKESEQKLERLNRELKMHSIGASPEVRGLINDVRANETKSDNAANQANQQQVQEKQEAITNHLEKINENKAGLINALGNMDPESAEAKRMQKQIEAMSQMESSLLGSLKTTYPQGSPQAEACDNMIQLNDAEMQKGAIDQEILRVDNAVGALTSNIGALDDPDSTQGQRMKAQIEALNEIKERLETQKQESLETIQGQRNELKQNILSSPGEDRKFLADIRGDHLHANNQVSQQKLTNMRQQMQEIRTALRQNDNLSPEQREYLENRMDSLQDNFRQERRDYAQSRREENFWNRVENRPSGRPQKFPVPRQIGSGMFFAQRA